jgi:CRISPR-associated protein Cas6/Cse3/CasE subtype I-E
MRCTGQWQRSPTVCMSSTGTTVLRSLFEPRRQLRPTFGCSLSKPALAKKRNGKHIYFAHGDWRARRAWLDKQAAQNGFEVITVHITDKREVIDKANRFTVDSTRFTGALKVTDPEKFSAALNRGIGKCRTFGFGFLTI